MSLSIQKLAIKSQVIPKCLEKSLYSPRSRKKGRQSKQSINLGAPTPLEKIPPSHYIRISLDYVRTYFLNSQNTWHRSLDVNVLNYTVSAEDTSQLLFGDTQLKVLVANGSSSGGT